MLQKIKEKLNISTGRLIFTALITIFLITGGIALYNLIATEVSYTAAQQEYDDLRQLAPVTADQQPTDTEPGDEIVTGVESSTPPESPDDTQRLTEINPDYIGWIRIDGTIIDYPVVQGADNTMYERITFTRERNNAGTIFMDSRSVGGFDGFSFLYGHDMRNGSMFAGLHQFRRADFRDAYQDIQIIAPDGRILIYRIIHVFVTDVHDTIFTLHDMNEEAALSHFERFGIPEGSDVLILVTCTRGDRDERLLVIAERRI